MDGNVHVRVTWDKTKGKCWKYTNFSLLPFSLSKHLVPTATNGSPSRAHSLFSPSLFVHLFHCLHLQQTSFNQSVLPKLDFSSVFWVWLCVASSHWLQKFGAFFRVLAVETRKVKVINGVPCPMPLWINCTIDNLLDKFQSWKEVLWMC